MILIIIIIMILIIMIIIIIRIIIIIIIIISFDPRVTTLDMKVDVRFLVNSTATTAITWE